MLEGRDILCNSPRKGKTGSSGRARTGAERVEGHAGQQEPRSATAAPTGMPRTRSLSISRIGAASLFTPIPHTLPAMRLLVEMSAWLSSAPGSKASRAAAPPGGQQAGAAGPAPAGPGALPAAFTRRLMHESRWEVRQGQVVKDIELSGFNEWVCPSVSPHTFC